MQPQTTPAKRKRTTPGIVARHARSCPSHHGSACKCRPAWQANVYSARDGRRIYKTFSTHAAAKAWRADAGRALRRGELRAPTNATLREAAEAWREGAEAGTIRNRSGDAYKPSALRGYEAALRLRVLPDLGGARLSDVRRADLQDLADRLLAEGCSASTIRNTFLPLRAIFGRAVDRGKLAVNPTARLRLPAVRGGRDRIAAPDEATRLLTALEPRDRALWATAFYAGLRRGELQALRWEDVDLAGGKIHVRRSWDVKAGPIEPKSRAGVRTVFIPAVLRDYLDEHRLRSPGDGLVYGRTADTPFDPPTISGRAATAWKRAKCEPITLHECRHTFASMCIAAGVNAKALSTYMGHSSITVTLDRYGHLMPGNEEEAASLMDAYLERAATALRLAQLDA